MGEIDLGVLEFSGQGVDNSYSVGGSGVDDKAVSDEVHATQANPSAASGIAAQSWCTTAVGYRAGREKFGVDFAGYSQDFDEGIYFSGKRRCIQCLGAPTGGWATSAGICKGVQAPSKPYCCRSFREELGNRRAQRSHLCKFK